MVVDILNVEGMSCGHCVAAVEKALKNLSGIEKVQVDLDSKTVKVEYDDALVSLNSVKEAIEDQGYDVID